MSKAVKTENELTAADINKPGQTEPTPTPGDGDRVFYETLLHQRPDSMMAQEWCVKYGVLPAPEAERLLGLIRGRKGNKGKSPQRPKQKAVSRPAKKVKKARIDDDIQVSAGLAVGVHEGVGASDV